MRRADLRTLALLSLATISLAASFALHVPLLIAPSAVLVFVACIAKHNHMHCRTFGSRAANSLLQVWLSLLTGTSSCGIVGVHNGVHHRRNQAADDPVRCALARSRVNALNLAVFPVLAMREARRLRPPIARALLAQSRLERAAVWTLAIVLLAIDARAALLYVGVPWLAGQWALLGINLVQHQGCDPASEHEHSRDVTGPLNWLFLNNGFHTAHHERPSLHWSLLPEYHARVIAPRRRPGFEFASLAGALWERVRANGRA